jgi:ferrous iron transport protein B
MSQQEQTILQRAEALRANLGDPHQQLVEDIYTQAAAIADGVVDLPDSKRRFDLDRALDRIMTSRIWGLPIMVALLGLVLWITITGANIPSGWLATLLLDWVYNGLHQFMASISSP